MTKTYINWISAKRINWNYWEFFNISINLDKLKEYQNEKGWVNVTMSKRKEADKYWATESFVLNEYKPKKNTSKAEDISVEDIPFR